MKKATGKVVWITGGGSGIGAACAREFARRGATVAVSGRRFEALEKVVRDIETNGGTALAVPCDVTDEAQCRSAVGTVVERFGRLDICFANAGYGAAGPLLELDMQEWRAQFETNVFGLLHTLRAALPEVRKERGSLVLTSSVMGYMAAPGNGPYTASKFAVRAIGETGYLELRREGIAVTTICPGFVESEIGQVDNLGRFHPDWRDKRPAWLMWSSERAARTIVRAILARRRELVFTGHGKLAVAITRLCPGVLYRLMALGVRRP